MEFLLANKTLRLNGDPSLSRRQCGHRELKSLESNDDCWLFWVLERKDVLEQFGLSDSLTSQQRTELTELLNEFPLIAQPPSGLPPSRPSDHHIPLQPGSQPVSVRPYRYTHTQKDEMERLVDEMLAAGIIQPSSSPYSSPVLLVRKKDESWRFCVDYRSLNTITRINILFPLSRSY